MNKLYFGHVPNITFKTREGDELVDGGCSFEDGKWVDRTTDYYFKGKKVVIFALPGAFTPTCSAKQLPEYEKRFQEFKDKGIDEVYCISVNDTYVMNAWFADWKIKNVKPIADGNGHFTRRLGMLINKTDKGFGMRSWRYAAVVNDLKIEQWFEEPGINDNGSDDDPYGQSSPSNVLNNL